MIIDTLSSWGPKVSAGDAVGMSANIKLKIARADVTETQTRPSGLDHAIDRFWIVPIHRIEME
jgi:hypothetical protein